jgi:Ca2+-binding EF-hand superfamily protein
MLLEYLGMDSERKSFDKQEYLIFLLVRGNLLDLNILKRIFDKFEVLDSDKKGKISIAELIDKYEKRETLNVTQSKTKIHLAEFDVGMDVHEVVEP